MVCYVGLVYPRPRFGLLSRGEADLTRKRSLAQKIWGESEHNGHKASIMGGVTGHNRGILKESEHSIIGKN